MAVSDKYGKIDIRGIGADEPVFILRAQDRLAVTTVELYRLLTASHHSPVADRLGPSIESFRRWEGKRKLPD